MHGLVVHWDGKMLPSITGHTKVERLPILISTNGVQKLLGVPICEDGSGEAIANAVHDVLVEWNLLDKVEAMCFDTTSTNTGRMKGACQLQRKMERKLLPMACRHHVFEIVLRSVYEVKMGKTTAPGVPIFERFQKINQKVFQCGAENSFVRQKISGKVAQDIIAFCEDRLTKAQPRSDYKEFLGLSIIFLGGKLTNFKFARPGATSHARWMAKGIYALKIYLFRDQFIFNNDELIGIRDICIFIVNMYLDAWFQSTNGVVAPNNDLNFIKKSIAYAIIDKSLSNAALDKMRNHLWYLSPEMIGFAFFDPAVSLEEKRKMVASLKKKAKITLKRGVSIEDLRSFTSKNLSDFVTEATLTFFNNFRISTEFLLEDPSTWNSNQVYLEGSSFCHGLHVVNDLAERGVKLMTDYNSILTKDEDAEQYLLQVVENYRREYPTSRKSDLLNEVHISQNIF